MNPSNSETYQEQQELKSKIEKLKRDLTIIENEYSEKMGKLEMLQKDSKEAKQLEEEVKSLQDDWLNKKEEYDKNVEKYKSLSSDKQDDEISPDNLENSNDETHNNSSSQSSDSFGTFSGEEGYEGERNVPNENEPPEAGLGDFVAALDLLKQSIVEQVDLDSAITTLSRGMECIECKELKSSDPNNWPTLPSNVKISNFSLEKTLNISDISMGSNSYDSIVKRLVGDAQPTILQETIHIDEMGQTLSMYVEAFSSMSEEVAADLAQFIQDLTIDKVANLDEDVSTKFLINYMGSLPDNYQELFLGRMDEEQLAEFISGIDNYYDKELDLYSEMKGKNQELLEILNSFPLSDYRNGWADMLLDSNSLFMENVGIQLDLDLGELFKSDEKLGLDYYDLWNQYKENGRLGREEYIRLLDTMVQNNSALKELEITSFEQLIEQKKFLDMQNQQLTKSILLTQDAKNNVKNEYLVFSKEYKDYWENSKDKRNEIALRAEIEKFVKYDYDTIPNYELDKVIQEKFGKYGINSLQEFIKIGDNFSESEIDIYVAGSVDKNLIEVYNYLLEKEGKDAADNYVKYSEERINLINGSLGAKAFLDSLSTGDGKTKIDDFLENTFKVDLQGLSDGINTYQNGLKYALEGALTGLGYRKENRHTSEDEYRKMYILQGLISEKDREKMGLITRQTDGTLINNIQANPYNIIDFTKNYTSSGLWLSGSYEISQGIGNMLPSMMLSMINPVIGSVSMGISAGGNAYHNSMVEGNSLGRSLLYGVASGCTEAITEKFLGGLPGLSNTEEVKGLLSLGKTMFSEGMEEFYQDFIDMAYQGVILGKPVEIPKTEEEWWEAIKNRGKTFIYGAITAGIMQSPNLLNIMKNPMIQSKYDILLAPVDKNNFKYDNNTLIIENRKDWYTYISQQAKYRETIDGITFVSNTQEGLELMKYNYKLAIESFESFADELVFRSRLLKTKYITDITYDSDKPRTSFSSSPLKLIYMYKGEENYEWIHTLFHETGHQLDTVVNGNRIGIGMSSIFNSMLVTLNIDEYLDSEGKLKPDANFFIPKDWNLQSYYDKFMSDRKKGYSRGTEIGDAYDFISDIYDALLGGQLRSFGMSYGHGIEYYSNYDKIGREIAANVSAIISMHQIDALYKYFPKEIASKMVNQFFNGVVGYDERVTDTAFTRKLKEVLKMPLNLTSIAEDISNLDISEEAMHEGLKALANGDDSKMIYIHPEVVKRYFDLKYQDKDFRTKLLDIVNGIPTKMDNEIDQLYVNILGKDLINNYLYNAASTKN